MTQELMTQDTPATEPEVRGDTVTIPVNYNGNSHAATNPVPIQQRKWHRTKRYISPSKKAEVLRSARETSIKAAAEAHGVAYGSVYNWMRKARAKRVEAAAKNSGKVGRPAKASSSDSDGESDAELLKTNTAIMFTLLADMYTKDREAFGLAITKFHNFVAGPGE